MFSLKELDEPTDRGITLVELLVYMLLAVVVLVLVGSFLINSLRVDSQVRAGAEAASNAQTAVASLGRGVRNASALEVTNPAPDTTLVRTRSIDSGPDGEWFCNAWHLSSDGELRWRSSPSALPAAPDEATIGSWLLIVDNVQPVGATPMLGLGPDGRSLAISFQVENGDGAPVLLETVIIPRQPIPSTGEVSEPCF